MFFDAVTMQGQKTAPPDMQLKDKFLVQATVVPFGTTEEDIIPEFVSIIVPMLSMLIHFYDLLISYLFHFGC